MKTNKLNLILKSMVICLFIIVNSCSSKDEENHGQLLINSTLESGSAAPESWNYSFTQEGYIFNWSNLVSHSPSHSLSISTSVSHGEIATWMQTYSTNIPFGHQLVLTAAIKCNLSGDGVAIVIRGDDTATPSGNAELFASTQGMFSITGTADWKDWSIATSSEVSNSIQSITVYLIYLPNTTGEVFFDDITLNPRY